MAFSLTPRQAEAQRILRGPQRHTLIYGGGRSGKTFLLVRALVTRAIFSEGSRHAILRLRANAARSSVALDTLQKVMKLCYPGVSLIEHRMDGYYELPNRAQIWIGGLDDKKRVEKILGQEFVTMYLNECSQIEYGSVLVARTRLAQVVEGYNPQTRKKFPLPQRMYYDLNPVGTRHWSYQEFVAKRDVESGKPLKNPERFVYLQMNPVDNRQNLTSEMLAEYEALPERQRKRFFEGAYQNDIDGALWTLESIEKCRCEREDVPELTKKVVAIDPSGTRGDEDERSNNVGIIVAGLGVDGRAYLLEDLTCNLPPAAWARIAVQAYHRHKADRVVGEINYGGAMVKHVIMSADPNVQYREVSASRGKWVRAEPISGFYEKDKVRHVGRFPELEEEMENFSTSGYLGERSPDRADAMVWAMTDLLIKGDNTGFLDFMRDQVETAAAQRAGSQST